MTENYRLNLLGEPYLRDGKGTVVAFRSRKHFALFVYLTREGRDVAISRKKLAELFWPNADKRRRAQSLRQALMDIKNKLGPEVFSELQRCVRLQLRVQTELDDVKLWTPRSEVPIPLEDLETCAGGRFAHWVEVERERIVQEIRSRLTGELSEARVDGRPHDEHQHAELLYSFDPYNEIALQSLVEKHLSAGDWTGAFQLVGRHIKKAASELGPSPSAEVLASLRRFERAVLRDAVRAHAERGGAPYTERGQLLIGRQSELGRLEALMWEVVSSRCLTCALRGPAGIGKSAVLRHFATMCAARKAPVYLVNCQEIGQNIPFAALSDLLDQISAEPAVGGTDPIWLAEASRVAPGIRAAYPGIPAPLDTPPETVRVRLCEAIRRMLEEIAHDSPLFLVFDDMHYMDPASRDVLHLLARRLDETPTLILAAARWSRTDTSIGGGEGLKGIDWHQTIDVNPLDDTHTRELIAALAEPDRPVDDAAVAKIVELAQGNPLLIEMLVADWLKSGPNSLVMANIRGDRDHGDWRPLDTMRSALARQYAGLSDSAERLVRLLATAGRSLPLEVIPRLLALPSETVGSAVYALMERGILTLDGNAVCFKNDLHRAFVYSTLPEETRKYQHAHLAQHLSADKDRNDFQHALEASHHFLKAEWISEARELACTGAERAIIWGAPKEAQKALEAVIAVDPQSGSTPLHLYLARALAALGKYQDALDALAAWQPEYPTQNEEAFAATTRAEALHRGRLADDDNELANAVRFAFDAAVNINDQRLIMAARQIAAEVAYEAGDWEGLQKIEQECTTLGRTANDKEVRGLAHLTLGYCRLVSGDPHVAADLFSHSVESFQTIKLDSKLHRALTGLGISTSSVGVYGKAIQAFKAAAAAAARAGDSVANANALLNLGSLSNDLGRFSQAAGYFSAAIDLDRSVSTSRVSTAIYCNAANLSLTIGNFGEADAFLDAATEAAQRSQLWQHFVNVRLTGADLHLAKGAPDAAWALVKEALVQTGERHRLVPDLGQYWRLRRHYFLITGDDCARPTEVPKLTTLAHQLEFQAFEEGYPFEEQKQGESTPALTQLVQFGLFGVLAKLAAVGIRYGPLESLPDVVSGARAIVEAFPDQGWETIPAAVLTES